MEYYSMVCCHSGCLIHFLHKRITVHVGSEQAMASTKTAQLASKPPNWRDQAKGVYYRGLKIEALEFETPDSLRYKMAEDDQFAQRMLQPVLQIFDHPVQQITNTQFNQFQYRPDTKTVGHSGHNGEFGYNFYLGTRLNQNFMQVEEARRVYQQQFSVLSDKQKTDIGSSKAPDRKINVKPGYIPNYM